MLIWPQVWPKKKKSWKWKTRLATRRKTLTAFYQNLNLIWKCKQRSLIIMITWTLPSSKALKTFFSFSMCTCTRCKCSCVCVFTQVLAYVWVKMRVNMCAYMWVWVWSQVLYLITRHFIFLCQGLPLNPELVNSHKPSWVVCSGAVSWEPGLQMIAMLAWLVYVLLFL